MFPEALSRRILLALLAAALLMGMGRVLTLPPFDGTDETAHYSRIEAAAFAGPEQEAWFISKDVTEYYKHGPMPPGWIAAQAFNAAYNEALGTGRPPRLSDKMKEQGYRDYHAFFSRPDKKYAALYRLQPAPRGYAASAEENWQYQHPPLYYLLMGRVLRLAAGGPLVQRLLVLRTVSFLMAFAGFALGLLATYRHLVLRGNESARDIVTLGAFYPFAMPVFFAEFARLGNDSLCLLMFSAVWALVLWHLRRPREKAVWAIMGLAMGYAWMAKAFMIPVTLGLLAFLALRPLAEEAPQGFVKRLWRRLQAPLAAGLAACGVGIWPYINKQGALGSQEISAWLHGRGFLKPEEGIAYDKILRNLEGMLGSTTANFGEMNVAWINFCVAVMFLLVAAVFAAWLLTRPRDPRREEWLPLWPLAPLAGGLALHGVLAAAAYRAAGVTPGYYIHVCAPALALMFGTGLYALLRRAKGRWFTVALLLAAISMSAASIALRLYMYAGCLWLSDKFTALGAGGCTPETVFGRLALLAWPAFGLPCIALSLLLLLWASARILTAEKAVSAPPKA